MGKDFVGKVLVCKRNKERGGKDWESHRTPTQVPPPPEGARERRWGGSVLHSTAGHLQKIVGPSLSKRHPTREPYVSQDRISSVPSRHSVMVLSHQREVWPQRSHWGRSTSPWPLGLSVVRRPRLAFPGMPRWRVKAFNLNNRICVPWEMVYVD